MTIQQLKYVLTVADKGTISGAAQALYIAQPSLTSAIKELEQELGITIFNRTNKGTVISRDGEVFLGYARQVVEQVNLLEEKYKGEKKGRQDFCVSTQHYSFAVEAFVDLLREHGGEEYDFRLRETQTHEILEDVARLRSEVGIIYLNRANEEVIRKQMKANNLKFHHLFRARPHVFVYSEGPLAKKKSLTLEDLEPYPRLSFEQGEYNSFYYSEEILGTLERPKNILVRDRATLFNLLIGLNGYTISSGIISEELNGKNIVAVPLDVDDYMDIGYITHESILPSRLGMCYIEALKLHTIPLTENGLS